jgi:hypothetical protein
VGHLVASELFEEDEQLIRLDAEHDCVGACGQITGTGLSGCVGDLGGQKAQREVAANYDVVGERGFRLTVKGS